VVLRQRDLIAHRACTALLRLLKTNDAEEQQQGRLRFGRQLCRKTLCPSAMWPQTPAESAVCRATALSKRSAQCAAAAVFLAHAHDECRASQHRVAAAADLRHIQRRRERILKASSHVTKQHTKRRSARANSADCSDSERRRQCHIETKGLQSQMMHLKR
jgi:hypothetical protein